MKSLLKSLFGLTESTKQDEHAAEAGEGRALFAMGNGHLFRETSGYVVFLDLDGVAHPYDHGTLEYLPAFEEMMARHPNVDVVISSDWRLTTPIEDLLGLFSEAFRHRIVGTTPDLGTTSRHPEVMQFVTKHKIRNWIAVDDRQELFPESCTYLFLTDRSVGLTSEWMEKLSDRILTLSLGGPIA